MSVSPLFWRTHVAETIVKHTVLLKNECLAMVLAHPCGRNHGETVTFVQICETVVTFWTLRGGPVVTPGTRGSKNGPGNERIDKETGLFLFERETMVGRAGASAEQSRGNRGAIAGGGFHPKRSPIQLARLFI